MRFAVLVIVNSFFYQNQHQDTGQGRCEGHHVRILNVQEKLRIKLKKIYDQPKLAKINKRYLNKNRQIKKNEPLKSKRLY